MMSSLAINWGAFDSNLEAVGLLAQVLGPKDFPNFLQVGEGISVHAENLYREYLRGKVTPAGKCVQRPSRATSRGVTRAEAGLLLWTIANDSPVAKALEEGTPERDMKLMLPASKRARRSKDGFLYLIIPFRHGTPGARGMDAMPRAVYDRVVKFKFSKNVGAPADRLSATGWRVPRFFYSWQDKLSPKTLQAMGLDDAAVKKYSGMHRMEGGNGQSSGYLTFRVLSQKSKGWVRPATPGLEPLRYAVDQAIAEGMAALEDAFERDVMQALGLAESGII